MLGGMFSQILVTVDKNYKEFLDIINFFNLKK